MMKFGQEKATTSAQMFDKFLSEEDTNHMKRNFFTLNKKGVYNLD